MTKFKNLTKYKFILMNTFGKKGIISSNKYHLKKAMEWLQYAYLKSDDDGVSGGYSLIDGWKISDPIISSGLISTLIEYNKTYNLDIDRNCSKLLRIISKWLCSIQLRSGAYRFGITDDEVNKPSAFSTGCVLSGLIDAYNESKDKLYEYTVIKAGNYLVSKIQKDGSWVEQCFNDNTYSFNIMTSWSLLRLYILTGDLKYRKVAISNIRWTYKQKRKNFWFNNSMPNFDNSSSLRYILYIARGFLECGLILNNDSISRVALDVVYILSKYFDSEKKLPMVFTDKWYGLDEGCYSVYIAQLSMLLLRLYEIYGIKKYIVYALRLNDYLKVIQSVSKKRDISGAIRDTNPIQSGYSPFTFSSNTTKIFCDTLMFEGRCY